MTVISVFEWDKIHIGHNGISIDQAHSLMSAVRSHPFGGDDGGDILSDHRKYLKAKQMVGVIAAAGCSLEILPKIDSASIDLERTSIRNRLVYLLDLAFDLELGVGNRATMAHSSDSLLDVIIKYFASEVVFQIRRGMPKNYSLYQDDLSSLRGGLDIRRQFTKNAARPDRLACQYDLLSGDIPLMQIIKSTTVFLTNICRNQNTKRLLDEIRFMLSDISDVGRKNLLWNKVSLNRQSQHWNRALSIAHLLLQNKWQDVKYDAHNREGLSFIFPMNKLFEQAVTVILRRAFFGTGIDVVAQGGMRYCLSDWSENIDTANRIFQTKPDIILRSGSKILAILDIKWKSVSDGAVDPRWGVSQSDVYQMMAYSRIYNCNRLMLLYPARLGDCGGVGKKFRIADGDEMLALGMVDLSVSEKEMMSNLVSSINSLIS